MVLNYFLLYSSPMYVSRSRPVPNFISIPTPPLPSSQHDHGGGRDDAWSRQLKERHKGRHGNHNRRYLADRKRNKGMGAPPRYWGRGQCYVPVDHTRLECVVHKHSNITYQLHHDLYIAIQIYINNLRIDHSLMYNMQTWGPGFDSQWLLVFQALFPSCPHPQFMIQSRAQPVHASQ